MRQSSEKSSVPQVLSMLSSLELTVLQHLQLPGLGFHWLQCNTNSSGSSKWGSQLELFGRDCCRVTSHGGNYLPAKEHLVSSARLSWCVQSPTTRPHPSLQTVFKELQAAANYLNTSHFLLVFQSNKNMFTSSPKYLLFQSHFH